jgi:PKD repeat protein
MARVRWGASAQIAVALLVLLQACSASPAQASSHPAVACRDAKIPMGTEEAGPRWVDNTSQVELLSQNLTVVLYPENRSISVTGDLRLKFNYDVGELSLWLYKTLNITRLEEGGAALEYGRNASSDRIAVSFSPKVAKGRVLDISCAYEGEMWYLEDGLRQDCVGTDGAYVKGSTHWYIMHHSSDWANYNLTFCCPENWTAVADGELVSEEHAAGWANFTWVTDRPCMRPAFAADNYSVLSKSSVGINITAYTYPEDTALASRYIDEAASVLSEYSNILGPYDRKSFKIVETAHQTMTGYACSGFVMLYPDAFKSGKFNYNLLSHETAHEWFPFATGYAGWAYPWLWEGFSEYLSCIYEKDKYGSWARLDRDRTAFIQILGDPIEKCIRATDWVDPLSYPVLYAKGAWVLHMLRGMLGDAAFFSALKDYVTENLYAMGSAELFIADANKHSPFSLDDFFQQWLNTTKDLDVSIAAARLYENGTVFFLELEPVNLQCATNPADIRIEYADSTSQTLRLGWNGTCRLICLPVALAVSRVQMDPGGWLLDIDRQNDALAPERAGNIYDLQMASIDAPSNLSDGQQVSITALVRNNSSYPVKAARLDFFMDGRVLSTRSLDIPQKSSLNSSLEWPAAEGRHNLSVVVDLDGKFHEWDETNNNLSLEIDVAPAPPKVDLCAEYISMVPSYPMMGDCATFSANVRNLGEAAVSQVRVQFLVDNQPLESIVVAQLNPGASKTLSVKWHAKRGFHNVSAVVDPLELVTESDEGNNRADASFFVGWPLGLILEALPETPMPGERASFKYQSWYGVEILLDFGDSINTGWHNASGSYQMTYHTYDKPGAYVVRLMGRSEGMEEEISLQLNVTVRPLVLTLSANVTSVLTLVPVLFKAQMENLGARPLSVRWDFGDGSRAYAGLEVSHIYARPGTYGVSFSVINQEGDLPPPPADLTIEVLDRPPQVRWEGPQELQANARAAFVAYGSDPDGNITIYHWSFGDGGNATGALVEHAYRRAGRYLVTVVAVDDTGSNASCAAWVVVEQAQGSAPSLPLWPFWLVPVVGLVVAGGFFLSRWNRRRAREYEDFFLGRR